MKNKIKTPRTQTQKDTMPYLYLNESGDLGLSKSSSKFFTINAILLKDIKDNNLLIKSIKKAIKKKLISSKGKRFIELKGTKLQFEIKKYIFQKIQNIDFEIYSIVIEKKYFKNELKNKGIVNLA